MASQIVDEAAPRGDVSPGTVPAVTFTDAQKAGESKHARLKAEVRESLPAIDLAVTAQELEFLLMYRRANKADKRRLDKILHAAGRGLLPSAEEANAMTPAQRRAFADALPEVE